MKSTVAFAKLPAAHPDLGPLLGQFQYAWLEGVSAAKLAFLDEVPAWNDLSLWTAGRIFGETGEYRWEYDTAQNELHAVMLLENNSPPPFFNGCLMLEKEEKDASLILWGDWVVPAEDPEENPDGGAVYYAPAIPLSQHYPLQYETATLKSAAQEGLTPRLVIRRYRHDEHGEFSRCVSVSLSKE